jgi:hypothetical protein
LPQRLGPRQVDHLRRIARAAGDGPRPVVAIADEFDVRKLSCGECQRFGGGGEVNDDPRDAALDPFEAAGRAALAVARLTKRKDDPRSPGRACALGSASEAVKLVQQRLGVLARSILICSSDEPVKQPPRLSVVGLPDTDFSEPKRIIEPPRRNRNSSGQRRSRLVEVIIREEGGVPNRRQRVGEVRLQRDGPLQCRSGALDRWRVSGRRRRVAAILQDR